MENGYRNKTENLNPGLVPQPWITISDHDWDQYWV